MVTFYKYCKQIFISHTLVGGKREHHLTAYKIETIINWDWKVVNKT